MKIILGLTTVLSLLHLGQSLPKQKQNYCKVNEFDKPFNCECPFGTAMNSIISFHNNDYEDRQWTVDCRLDVIYGISNKMTTPESRFDETFIFEFINDNDELGFLSGMYSFHDDEYEDRVFSFDYTFSNDHKVRLGTCRWEQVNELDSPMNLVLRDDEVINGVESNHNNDNEDRIFTFKICNIEKITR